MSTLSEIQLYQLLQLAQRLLVLDPRMADGTDLLEPFHGVCGITSVCVFDAATNAFLTSGSVAHELVRHARAAYVSSMDADDPTAGLTVRCLTEGNRITGAVAFKGLEDAEQTAGSFMALVAALLERTRIRRKLGDELKNGITTILAAAGGLREAGSLSATQLDMVLMVEAEASRMASMIP